MSAHVSTGLVNYLQMKGNLKRFLQGSIMLIYAGTQPAAADNDIGGATLLNTISLNSGSFTPETVATGTVTLTGGASGSVNTITVNGEDVMGGAVTFDSSLSQTATDIAAQINQNGESGYTASATGAVVTLYAPLGKGALVNTQTVSATLTTITASYANMSGGVTEVNGLTWGLSLAGVLSQSGVWSGVGAANGTPGWFRIVRNPSDATGATTTLNRLDGTISTSSADLNINPNVSTIGVTLTIGSFSVQNPES